MTIAKNLKSTLPKTNDSKEFKKFLKECSQTVNKSLTSTLMSTLISMKYNSSHTMQQHVLEMMNLSIKLQTLGMK